MCVQVYIPSFLTRYFNGEKIIKCLPGKLSDILESISKKYPEFKNKFYEPNGRLKEYVTLFLEDKIINKCDLASIYVNDNQKIKIYVALIGG
jgi:hypothetical protein